MPTQAMDIDGLLASTAMVDQGGARTLTDRGELVYDLGALTEALRHRCANFAHHSLVSCVGSAKQWTGSSWHATLAQTTN